MPKPTQLPDPVSEEKKKQVAEAMRQKAFLLHHKIVTAGFDGFVDSIARVIETRENGQEPGYFASIESFGHYILQKKSSSFSIEIETHTTKIGGNMPIMSNAMALLGTKVNCIGAFGYPHLHEQFKSLPPSCNLLSFAQPGTATALEFGDGKIMMADMAALHKTGWEEIKARIPLATMINLYASSDMFALLNWSEIDASSGIWKGIIKDVLIAYDSKTQFAFFDLSDCSKRTEESIQEMLALINDFAKRTRVILSLNRNEAGIVYKILSGKTGDFDISEQAAGIFDHMKIETVIIHTSKEVIAISGQGRFSLSTFFAAQPLLSTGAGDNFNAGFCTAMLLELDMESALIVANATSGYYVRNGKSGQLNDIVELLEYKSS
jgi:sugar/nucleoside kinase (ribokinase family)